MEREPLGEIERTGVVAILRLDCSPGEAVEVAEAVFAAGIAAIEVALTADNALEQLEAVAKALGGRATIGAGTVLTKEQAREALDIGAEFLVSPGLSEEVIEVAGPERYIPGVMTPTELTKALSLGARLCKLFPAASLGPGYVKELLGPFKGAKLVPTGGISDKNAADFIRAGAVAVGVGGWLVRDEDVRRGAFDEINRRAHRLISAVKAARARG